MGEPVFSETEGIGLIDYFNILWRKKWLIIIPTLILMVFTGVLSFMMPEKWAVDSIVTPGKFFIETSQGEIVEVLVADPKQITSQINEKSYDVLIAAELGLNIRQFPELKAQNLRETNLVRISMNAQDPKKGKLILSSLYNHLRADLDKKIKVEIIEIDTQVESKKNNIRTKETQIKLKENEIALNEILIKDKRNEIKTKQNRIKDKENLIRTKNNEIKLKENEIEEKNINIQSKELDKEMRGEEIKTLSNKLSISEEREKAITEEMKEVKDRINKIEEDQRKVLKKGSKKNAMASLLYSNEIQNNLRYYNNLDKELKGEKINQENFNFQIEEKKFAIKEIDKQIEKIKINIDDANTRIDDIKTRIEDIKTEIDDIHTQISDLENGIGKINNKIESIKNEIQITNNEIANIETQITFLEEKKARIDYTRLVKPPTASINPVSPQKKRNVLIACIAGLFVFSVLAFLLEYVEKQRIASI